MLSISHFDFEALLNRRGIPTGAMVALTARALR
jgi:hypothetical protein